MSIKKAKAIEAKIAEFDAKLQQYEKAFQRSGGATEEEQKNLDECRQAMEVARKKVAEVLSQAQAPPSSNGAPQSKDPKKRKGDTGTYTDVTTQTANRIAKVFNGEKIDGNDIHWNDVAQGNTGDCYFLAAIGAVAKANPESLRNLIDGPDKDGNYKVTLYIDGSVFSARKKTTVTVSPEFYVDSNGVPIYAKAGDTEMWVMLIEKAYTILRKKEKPLGTIGRSGYEAIEGGWGEEGIEVLTGKEATKHKIKSMSDEAIKKMITDALNDKRPITTATIFGPAEGKKANKKQLAAQNLNLILGHMYFVLSFDGKTIKLQNPWNDEIVDGDGRGDIDLSFEDYKKYYQTISVQDK